MGGGNGGLQQLPCAAYPASEYNLTAHILALRKRTCDGCLHYQRRRLFHDVGSAPRLLKLTREMLAFAIYEGVGAAGSASYKSHADRMRAAAR